MFVVRLDPLLVRLIKQKCFFIRVCARTPMHSLWLWDRSHDLRFYFLTDLVWQTHSAIR